MKKDNFLNGMLEFFPTYSQGHWKQRAGKNCVSSLLVFLKREGTWGQIVAFEILLQKYFLDLVNN